MFAEINIHIILEHNATVERERERERESVYRLKILEDMSSFTIYCSYIRSCY
jgi:hypothetical protein